MVCGLKTTKGKKEKQNKTKTKQHKMNPTKTKTLYVEHRPVKKILLAERVVYFNVFNLFIIIKYVFVLQQFSRVNLSMLGTSINEVPPPPQTNIEHCMHSITLKWKYLRTLGWSVYWHDKNKFLLKKNLICVQFLLQRRFMLQTLIDHFCVKNRKRFCSLK